MIENIGYRVQINESRRYQGQVILTDKTREKENIQQTSLFRIYLIAIMQPSDRDQTYFRGVIEIFTNIQIEADLMSKSEPKSAISRALIHKIRLQLEFVPNVEILNTLPASKSNQITRRTSCGRSRNISAPNASQAILP